MSTNLINALNALNALSSVRTAKLDERGTTPRIMVVVNVEYVNDDPSYGYVSDPKPEVDAVLAPAGWTFLDSLIEEAGTETWIYSAA
jgi:hypothetical protein